MGVGNIQICGAFTEQHRRTFIKHFCTKDRHQQNCMLWIGHRQFYEHSFCPVQQHIDTDCTPGIAIGRGCIQSGNKHHNPERNPKQNPRNNTVHCIDFRQFMLFRRGDIYRIPGRHHFAILGIACRIFNSTDGGFAGVCWFKIQVKIKGAKWHLFLLA